MSLPVRRPGRAPILARARTQATDLLRRLADEARRIEQDLRRTGPGTAAAHQRPSGAVPTASTQLATVLAQLADERSGPLATVRGLIEHTAHRASVQPGTGAPTPRTAWN
ncbi:hypothetical protein ACFW6E_43970 [Streptomyces olivaceoviridis]|uniref:hypothetical protein n=1 Tax=Streptomyces olivaceoviridis TaxID=1921 RepID=UPI0036B4CF44